MIHVVKIDNKQKSRRNVNFYIFQFWAYSLTIFILNRYMQASTHNTIYTLHLHINEYEANLFASRTSSKRMCKYVLMHSMRFFTWGVERKGRDGFHQTNIRSCYSFQLIKVVVSDHDRFNMELIYVVSVQRNHREKKR